MELWSKTCHVMTEMEFQFLHKPHRLLLSWDKETDSCASRAEKGIQESSLQKDAKESYYIQREIFVTLSLLRNANHLSTN